MRVSILACVAGALGSLGGGWLVGRWCFGLVLIALGAGLVAWSLLRDDGRPAAMPQLHGVPTLEDVLERARRAP